MLKIHNVKLPLRRLIHTAHELFEYRSTILLELSYKGQTLWGEAPAFATNHYMPETHESVWAHLIELGPAIRKYVADDSLDGLCKSLMDYPILCSCLDMLAIQIQMVDSNQLLSDFFDCSKPVANGSAMLGIFNSEADYTAHINSILSQGYKAIKFKITPESLPYILPLISRALHQFDRVSVDANGSFDNVTYTLLEKVPQSILLEQPVIDKDLLLTIIDAFPGRVILDESVRSMSDLVMVNGLNIAGVMLKPVCLGGIRPTLAMIDYCFEHNISCGVSGYLDSGIGRYFHWLMAQNSKLSLRPDFVWSDYYFDGDVCLVAPNTVTNCSFPTIDRSYFTESKSI
jgi:L-alanine-DL-glutamate epimerase-like enolase superfamily enzyme